MLKPSGKAAFIPSLRAGRNNKRKMPAKPESGGMSTEHLVIKLSDVELYVAEIDSLDNGKPDTVRLAPRSHAMGWQMKDKEFVERLAMQISPDMVVAPSQLVRRVMHSSHVFVDQKPYCFQRGKKLVPEERCAHVAKV